MYCIVLSIMLFSFLYTKEKWIWRSNSKNLQVCGHHEISPSVETRCSPYSFTITTENVRLLQTYFSFFWYADWKWKNFSIYWFDGNSQSHINPEPAFTMVPSMAYSSIFFFFFNLCVLYYWIQFQIETLLILMRCKRER